MNGVRGFQFFGQELAPYVKDWGSVDDTKSLLLAQTQIFAGQCSIVLQGADKIFTPYFPGSPLYGRWTENAQATITLGGKVLYNGLVKSVDMNAQDRTTTIAMENYFSKPCSLGASLVANGVNPAGAMLTILANAGLVQYADIPSFNAAGAAASAAGASINVKYPADGSTSVLAALQAISELASIEVYVVNGLITAKAWTPYQGGGAGLKWSLDSSLVRSWGNYTQAYDNLNNVVSMTYGASLNLTLENAVSILQNGIRNVFTFSAAVGADLAVPDIVSAQFFCQIYLDRASTLKGVLDVDAGPEMESVLLGDRFPVTCPNLGMTAVAMEVIETHRKIQAEGIGLKLVTI